MPSWIGRVCGRSLRESLREQVAAVPQMTQLQCDGIQDDRIDLRIGHSRPGLLQVHQPAAGLGAMTKVDQPLLVPDCVNRSARDRAYSGHDIRPAKSAEGLLLLEPDIGTRDPERAHHQVGSQVRLVELVLMGKSSERASVPHIAPLRVHHIPRGRRRRRNPGLHVLPFCQVRHIVDAGREGLHLLIHLLSAKVGGVDAEL